MSTTYYHVSPGFNEISIRDRGLLTSMSQGKLAAVWICTKGQLPWACLHVLKRHRVSPFHLVIFRVKVSRETLVKHGKGRFYRMSDVSPLLLEKVKYEEVIA